MQKLLKLSGPLLGICFLLYLFISWILFYQDTRALLAISNFYPYLRTSLFATQTTLMHFKLNTVPTLLFAIFAISAIYFYYQSFKITISVKKTILFSLLFGFILFLSYPGLSSDLFSYIFSDRIATVYHQNVWEVMPLTHNTDPFAIMADWKNTTRVYGGVNQLIYTLPSLLGGNNIIILVILYKLVSSIFALGIIWMLYVLLKDSEKGNKDIAKYLRMVIWNPLFLIEFFGSGHNDSIMIFFTLISYYFYSKKRYLFSGIMLAFAVQVKIIPVLLCVFFIISLLRSKSIKNACIFAGSFLLINIISFWLMDVSPITFLQRVSYNAGVYWQSLPNLFRQINPHSNYFFTGLFLVSFCILIYYQVRLKQNPLLFYAYALVIYLFIAATAYWNWYALWTLTLIPLLQNSRIKLFIISFSCTSLLAYPLYWLSLRYDYHNVIWTIVTYMFIFILPVILLLLAMKKKLVKQITLLN